MNAPRLGSGIAIVAIALLPACSTWHNLTDRITGRTSRADTAMRPGSDTTGAPGGSMTAVRDARTPTATAGLVKPGTFTSYAECRAWLDNLPEERRVNRGATAGGEVTRSDQDPCASVPRR